MKFENIRGNRKFKFGEEVREIQLPTNYGGTYKGLKRGSSVGEKMTEAEYELESARAELLGLPKPDRDEFFSRQREIVNEKKEEEIPAEEAENEGVSREGFQRLGGGLEELNNILARTQKKLNRFKVVCGSFSNLLKLQIGAQKEENQKVCNNTQSLSTESQESGEISLTAVAAPSGNQCMKGGGSELDKLDSLICKAERAELSLSSQNKQMKKFLN